MQRCSLLSCLSRVDLNEGEIDFGQRDRALVTRDIAAGKRNTENKSNPRGLGWQVEAAGAFRALIQRDFVELD